MLKKLLTFLFGGKIGTGPFFKDIGGNGIALIIVALTLINFFNCDNVVVEMKLIIVWLDLNLSLWIILSQTVGVTAKNIQLHELTISSLDFAILIFCYF